jgi:hypothetical protein
MHSSQHYDYRFGGQIFELGTPAISSCGSKADMFRHFWIEKSFLKLNDNRKQAITMLERETRFH